MKTGYGGVVVLSALVLARLALQISAAFLLIASSKTVLKNANLVIC
jgi:hypothetical protein